MSPSQVSELGPVDPSSLPGEHWDETESKAPWIVRKLAGSLTGRVVMSSYESFRAAGTSVLCLSPWGDSSPLLLPCIRFRDLVMHAVIAGTGGMAAVAAPVMGPVSDAVVSSFGDTIVVEMGLHAGFDVGSKIADDLIIEKSIKAVIPTHSSRLHTTSVKTLLVTLKYKHTMSDASLGFFRSSLHKDPSLFATVKDYLAVEKGWFSPYLFASNRRPVIPRTMQPDVIFCHGPFLAGDYQVGEKLLQESAAIVHLCEAPPQVELPPPAAEKPKDPYPKYRPISNFIARHRTPEPPSTPPAESASEAPTILPSPPERRMVMLLLGLKPHRTLWSTSHRPDESVINYMLLNGCPAVVLPAKQGCPLVAWDTITLEQLHKIGKSEGGVDGTKFKGVVDVLFEYLSLCVDWSRIIVPRDLEDDVRQDGDSEKVASNNVEGENVEPGSKHAVRSAIEVLVAGAVRSWDSKAVKEDVDLDRAGIAIFRIP
ncbi:hypothetical protein SISSUDRAFT_1054563 [Sistotremastrum suecicum HHB10207 ss-3]|uniref:Uncharacterized protein n=1 Tax=Sistotremastrum suecicum HHB10207 ss-3 TaxID=1314776 RepID=A0A165YEX1_9AGAM|nr:hypothetical protein SISSUDRAFT_1054563 [Sistotremastrum suecicum HHB10207 ss-3]